MQNRSSSQVREAESIVGKPVLAVGPLQLVEMRRCRVIAESRQTTEFPACYTGILWQEGGAMMACSGVRWCQCSRQTLMLRLLQRGGDSDWGLRSVPERLG